jgi:hypothetical protein
MVTGADCVEVEVGADGQASAPDIVYDDDVGRLVLASNVGYNADK